MIFTANYYLFLIFNIKSTRGQFDANARTMSDFVRENAGVFAVQVIADRLTRYVARNVVLRVYNLETTRRNSTTKPIIGYIYAYSYEYTRRNRNNNIILKGVNYIYIYIWYICIHIQCKHVCVTYNFTEAADCSVIELYEPRESLIRDRGKLFENYRITPLFTRSI